MSRVTCPTPRRDLSEPKRELSRGGADVSWRGRDMSGIPGRKPVNKPLILAEGV